MSLIIELINDYFSYIMLAVYATIVGFGYFFAVYFAKKKLSQFKNLKYLYASVLLIIGNVFFLIIAIQRYNQSLLSFFEGIAYFVLSLCATIIYAVLAIAVTANQNRPLKVKRITNKTGVKENGTSPN